MELTEEMLKSIRQQATDALTTTPQATALNMVLIEMVAEIQRQREEIAALQAEVESRQRMYETEGEMRRQSERLVEKLTWFNNALDAKPDAAPAPEIKVGDSVRIIEKHLMFSGESGHIMSIDGELYRVWLDVNLDPGENGISYYRNEIEPA